MRHKPKYGVMFVGYSAYVSARKYGRERDYAQLDFVSGAAFLRADCGWVEAANRVELGRFVRSLPGLVKELEGVLCKRAASTGAATYVDLSKGQNNIWIAPDAEVKHFVLQITKRFTEIENLLEQAEQIGASIERRPYSEYLEHIEKTGLCRVESHGFALFKDGRLIFFPNHQVVFTKPTERPIVFQVHALEPTTNGDAH